jgi:thiamine pyrophosphokinase
MAKTALVIANGKKVKCLKELARKADYVICADGGLKNAAKEGIRPGCIIGDFDSVSGRLVSKYPSSKVIGFPRDKDKTDAELAVLHARSLGFNKIVLVCALGLRIDHELANVFLLQKFPGLLRIRGDGFEMSVAGKNERFNARIGSVVSLFAIGGDAKGVTTSGLRFPLKDARIRAGSSLGVSNVASERTVKISIRKGCLLVVRYF